MSHRARHQLLAFPGIIFLVLFPIILSLWIAFFWAKSEVNNQLRTFAQRIGIPLATIREAFGVLPEGHTLSAKEWKQLSSQWREELDRRIHTLVALRDELDGCIGCGCLSRDCPLRNPGDRLGEEGTGARLLEDEQN